MELIVTIHSVIRWAVLALVVVGLGQALAPAFAAGARKAVASAFVGLLDLQLLLGIVLLFQEGALSTSWRHVVFMVLAVASAHVFHARAKRRPSPPRRLLLLRYVIPALLVLFGLIQVV